MRADLVLRIPGSAHAILMHSSESIAFDYKNSSKHILPGIVDEIGADVPFAVCIGAKDVLLGNFIHNLRGGEFHGLQVRGYLTVMLCSNAANLSIV